MHRDVSNYCEVSTMKLTNQQMYEIALELESLPIKASRARDFLANVQSRLMKQELDRRLERMPIEIDNMLSKTEIWSNR